MKRLAFVALAVLVLAGCQDATLPETTTPEVPAAEPATGPPGLAFHAMAYDAESDRVILFEGKTVLDELNGDTWAYDFDTNSWTLMNPATSPSGRDQHAMAYDAQSDRVILFGGGGDTEQSETWAYDFNTNAWTNMNSVRHPSGRWGHAMAYDEGSDRVVLFGGASGPGRSPLFYDDTWAYDFDTNAWTQLSPSTKPFGRVCFALAYDAESGRVILFGAETRNESSGRWELYDDTWAFDFQHERLDERDSGHEALGQKLPGDGVRRRLRPSDPVRRYRGIRDMGVRLQHEYVDEHELGQTSQRALGTRDGV